MRGDHSQEEEVSIFVTSEHDDEEESPRHSTQQEMTNVGRSVVLRLKRGEGTQNVKFEEDCVSDRIEVARAGVNRLLSFNKVFPPNVTVRSIYDKSIRHVVCRALSDNIIEHSTVFVYGSKDAFKSDTVSGSAYDNGLLLHIALDLLSSGNRITATAILLKGDQTVINLLTGTRAVTDVPVTHRVLDAIRTQMVKADPLATTSITFSIYKSTGCSKITVVCFADAEELTPTTRKHSTTTGEIIKFLATKRISESALKLAARKSKITHLLHSSTPPALTHDSQIVFISVSLTSLSDTSENVLRFTSDLCFQPQKDTSGNANRSYSISSSPPKPTKAPNRWTEAQPEVGVSTTQNTTRLEEELLDVKTQLFDCRNILKSFEIENNELQTAVTSTQLQSEQLLKKYEDNNKELIRLKDTRRSFQLRVAEGEQALQQRDQEHSLLLGENMEITSALLAITDEKRALSNENNVLRESLMRSSQAEVPKETLLTGSHPTTTEIRLLRKSLEKSQLHVRELADQLLSRSSDFDVTSKLLEHLDLSRELNKINAANADAYEKRIEDILRGAEEACDSERIFLLETRLEKSNRLLRKSELEFQQRKLDTQEWETKKEAEVRRLSEELRSVVEENKVFKQQQQTEEDHCSAIAELTELYKLQQENEALSCEHQKMSSEIVRLREDNSELQQQLEVQTSRMRNAEVKALDDVSSQLAHYSIANSKVEKENETLKSHLQKLKEELIESEKDAKEKFLFLKKENEQLQLRRHHDVDSLQQMLSAGEVLQDFLKKNEVQRFEENLNSELELNSQNKELKIQLQVQSVVISTLEKKLAAALIPVN